VLAAMPWTFGAWWSDVERTTWGLWPFGMERDEIRGRERWFGFVEAHDIARRWTDLPNWLTSSARFHERFPLWILDHLVDVDIPFEDIDRYLDSERLPFATPSALMLGISFADPVRFAETQLSKNVERVPCVDKPGGCVLSGQNTGELGLGRLDGWAKSLSTHRETILGFRDPAS